jgi:hypothetical protein
MTEDVSGDGLHTLQVAIGADKSAHGIVKVFMRDGAVHLEVSSAKVVVVVALQATDAMDIGSALYHLGNGGD